MTPRSRDSAAGEAVQRRAVLSDEGRVLPHPRSPGASSHPGAAQRRRAHRRRSTERAPDGLKRDLAASRVLRKHGILEGRREGTSVYYTVRDPRIFQLLEVSRQILTSSLTESQGGPRWLTSSN